jgi:hypothetical protein
MQRLGEKAAPSRRKMIPEMFALRRTGLLGIFLTIGCFAGCSEPAAAGDGMTGGGATSTGGPAADAGAMRDVVATPPDGNGSSDTGTVRGDASRLVDTGVPLRDGAAPSDAPPLRPDSASVSSDAGSVSSDARSASSDAGSISSDAGSASSDAGAASSDGGPARAFVHPGLLHSAQDFERMKTKVQASAEPWKSGWDRLVANAHAALGWTPRPAAAVYRGADGTHPENYAQLFNDAAAAYALALRWKVSGDSAYADKS